MRVRFFRLIISLLGLALLFFNISLLALVHFRGLCTANYNTVLDGDLEDATAVLERSPWIVHMRDQRGNTMLHLQVVWAGASNVKVTIQHGADVNALDGAGNTPLIVAVMYHRFPHAMELIEGGANIGQIDDNNYAELWSYLRYHPRVSTSERTISPTLLVCAPPKSGPKLSLASKMALALAGEARPVKNKFHLSLPPITPVPVNPSFAGGLRRDLQ